MNLTDALVCVECEEVFSAREYPSCRCPRCGDGSVYPLGRALLTPSQRRVTKGPNGAAVVVAIRRTEAA